MASFSRNSASVHFCAACGSVLNPGLTSDRTCVTMPPEGAKTPGATSTLLTVKSLIPQFGCPPAWVKPSASAFAFSASVNLQVLTLHSAAKKLSTPNAACAAGAEMARIEHAIRARSEKRTCDLIPTSQSGQGSVFPHFDSSRPRKLRYQRIY